MPNRPFFFGASLLALAMLTAGCVAHQPLDPPSTAYGQKAARAVQHWDVMARDVAARLAEKMRDWPPGAHPLHVVIEGDSGFNTGFRKLLITHLVDRGIAVSTEPGPVVLRLDTQLVQHNAGATWLPLAHGVSVVRDPYGEVVGTRLPVQPQDGARAEVLVSSSLEGDARYLARTADVYAIEQADVALYQERLSAVPGAAAPLKTWKVVAP
jgi:hypothetical protein